MEYLKGKIDGKTVYRCTGNGQGSCQRCEDNGKWNRSWMCMLYKLTPEDAAPCYCRDCIREVLK